MIITLSCYDHETKTKSELNFHDWRRFPQCLEKPHPFGEGMLKMSNLSANGLFKGILRRFTGQPTDSNVEGPILRKRKGALSLYFDDAAIQSKMRYRAPHDLVLGYTQSMMGFLLFNAAPRKIGMIGLGGGSIAKYCYRYLPESSMHVVENDPQVLALRERFLIPKDDLRLQISLGDGAEFVRSADKQFQVLLVDGFDRQGQPEQLCSQSFYDDCYRALSSEGILVVNLLGADQNKQACIERIGRSFHGAFIVIGALGSTNKIVFACKGKALDISEDLLLERLGNLIPHHDVNLPPTANSILFQRRLNALAELHAWKALP